MLRDANEDEVIRQGVVEGTGTSELGGQRAGPGGRSLTVGHDPSGQLPQVGQETTARPALEEHPAILKLESNRHPLYEGDLLLPSGAGERLGVSCGEPRAHLGQRTHVAPRP